MIYRSIELSNLIGVFKGLKQTHLKLDFEEDGFNVFSGKNGSGKTSLMRALTPFSESKDELIEEDELSPSGKVLYKEAYKKLWVMDKNQNYFIHHIYNKFGDKKSFLGKVSDKHDEVVTEELNPNGNTTSFNTIVEETFNLNSKDGSNIITTTESSSFLEMKSEERKKSIAMLIPDVSVYIEHYKRVREKVKNTENQINFILEDVKKFSSSKEELETLLESQNELHKALLDSYELNKELVNRSFGEYNSTKGQLSSFITQGDKDIGETVDRIHRNIADITAEVDLLKSKEENFNKLDISQLKLDLKKSVDAYKAVGEEITVLQSQLVEINETISVLNGEKFNAYKKSKALEDYEKKKVSVLEFESECNEDSDMDTETLEKIMNIPNYENELIQLRSSLTMMLNIQSHHLEDMSEFYPIDKFLAVKEEKYRDLIGAKVKLESDIRSYKELIESAAEFNKMGCNIDNCIVSFIEKIDINTASINSLVEESVPLHEEIRRITAAANDYKNVKFLFSDEQHNHIEIIAAIKSKGIELSQRIAHYKELSEKRKLSETNKKQLNIAKLELDDLFKVYDGIKCTAKVEEAESKISEAETLRANIQKSIDDLKENGRESYKESVKIEATLAEYEEFKELDSKLAAVGNLHSRLEKIERLSKTYNLEYANFEQRSKTLDTTQQSMEGVRDKCRELEFALKTIEDNNLKVEALNQKLNKLITISKALHPARGIPNIISNEKLFIIQNECNEILSKYFDNRFTLEFKNDEKSLDILVTSAYTGITSKYNNMSAGERSVIKLVLSVVIMQHKIGGNIDVVLLDEIDAFLDEDNRNSFELLLDMLKEDNGIKQIFIISHNIKVKGANYYFDKEKQCVDIT